MKIDSINKNVYSCSNWNRDRDMGEELHLDLNLGNIPADMQDAYVKEVEKTFCDEMTDEMVEYALSHGVWDAICNQ